VVILGRGGAGKSTLARELGEVSGLPVVELETLFWQPGPSAADPAQWTECQHELVLREAWILDGDLGSHDGALDVRLRAADTVIVLDFSFVRCAWRTVLRGRERADYWRWVWTYRRQGLPKVMQAVRQDAPRAKFYMLRNPRMVRSFVAEIRQVADNA
jgi:adenylate kinase family enzyme